MFHLRSWVSLTQPHKINFWGEGCPPLIYTILVLSLVNVELGVFPILFKHFNSSQYMYQSCSRSFLIFTILPPFMFKLTRNIECKPNYNIFNKISNIKMVLVHSVMNLHWGSSHRPRHGIILLVTYGESKNQTHPSQSPLLD